MTTKFGLWTKALVIVTLSITTLAANGGAMSGAKRTATGIMSIPVANAFTTSTLVIGSQGYDVDELQNRLKFDGYYKGKVDGQYGWQTYFAVRHFQQKFGLHVDGRVGLKTKQMLVKATQNWHYQGSTNAAGKQTRRTNQTSSSQNSVSQPVPGISNSDTALIAHVVQGEARGEPYRGQVAIAAVILNRMKDPKFPHSVPQIIYQPGSFTCVSDGQVNLAPDASSVKAVAAAEHGWDPSHGAVYYFNPATATNKWIWSRPEILQIGHHIFCR